MEELRYCGLDSAIKVPLLFGIREDAADLALDVPQGIAAEHSGSRDFVKHPLDIARANLTHPKAHATVLQMIRPNIAIPFYRGWSLLLLHARQVNALNEIHKRYGCLGCTVGLVNLGQCRLRQLSRLGLGDGHEDAVDRFSHLRNLLCDSDALHFTVNDASIKIADIPDSSRLEDVSVLLPFSFQVSSPFVLASVFARGLSPRSLAILLRSAAESFAFRAAAAFLAMAERSALVSELARATPPNLPRATAFGFFFIAMPCII